MSGERLDVDARIEATPKISREDLLDAVFGVTEQGDMGELLEPLVPRAEEWIDLADAGPYVDEMTVPLFSPNGDGSGGEETYGDPAIAAEWMAARLSKLPRVGRTPNKVQTRTSARASENQE
jgi:hypothetical protein